MKKVILIVAFVLGFIKLGTTQNDTMFHVTNMDSYVEFSTYKNNRATVQNDTVFHVTNMDSYVEFCMNKYDRALIYPDETCEHYSWLVNYVEEHIDDNPLIITPSMGYMGSNECYVEYLGCVTHFVFTVYFTSTNVPTETTEELWIHGGELAELRAVEDDSASMYNIHWNTGENENVIYKPGGTYIAGISDMCATSYRTKIVRETVEITASCDLATGYNLIEWETSAEQATYVQSVNIYYDYDENCTYSELVANVDYNAGSYVDTSHDSYQYPCQYHVVAVGYDGEECPLRSYWCRTISLSDLMGTQGTQTLQWTSYTTERDIVKQTTSVLAYQIYDVINGEAYYKATVGSFANTYNYDPSDFNGHGGVAAVLDGAKDGEAMAFARTRYKIGDPDGTEENHQNSTFVIYPNPATSGVINIRAMEQGDLNLTITNVMGQVIYSGVINGVFTSQRLTPGVYTVLCNGSAQKVVVE